MKTEITRKDEEKFLKLKIADNEVFSKPLNFEEIIRSILHGKIPLHVSDDDGTKILDEEEFSEIKRVVPFILNIVDKPRSFIRSLEEKVPVEIAKRINHKAIAKLSQDSNDWYARTLMTVKPKNIFADVNEETIDLYENRFICSLTDRIAKLVAVRRQYYQDLIKTIDDNNAIWAMDSDYHTTKSFPLFNKITIQNSSYQKETSFRDNIAQELKEIEDVEKKIRLIRRSDFYKTLHKKKKVVDPIQKTNILMFEFYYNQAYKLWKYLSQTHEEDKLQDQIDIIEEELDGYYMLYCLVLTFAALHDIGFAETSNKLIQFSDNKIKIDGRLVFDRDRGRGRDRDNIELWLDQHEIHLVYIYDKNRYGLDEFVLCPKFVNFEEMNRSQVNEYTENLLDSLVAKAKFNHISSKYAFVSINLNRCSENNTLMTKVYRRFYGIGSNYSKDESPEKLKKWAGYKTSIAIITPAKLRDNFLRIEKIINYHLLKNIDLKTTRTVCPLCDGSHIKQSGDQNYTCNDCRHNISITYCNVCDPNKKHPIIWVKYIDDKFLSRKDVIRGDFANNKIYDQMSKIEIIMGEKATTSFDLIMDAGSWKLKTICPYCGVILGDSKK